MKSLNEQINKMRKLTNLLENAQLDEIDTAEMPVPDEAQEFAGLEPDVVADLTNFSLNEGALDQWMAKLKQYAQKGALTASVVAALMAAPNLSQAQKQAVQDFSGGAQTTQTTHTLNVRELSSQERYDWNKFVDFLESKGLKNNPKMDVKSMDLGRKAMAEFQKLNPNTTLSYDLIPSIQEEMKKVQEFNARSFEKKGDTATAQNIRQGVSKLDGWLGSKTSDWKFPNVELRTVAPDGNTMSVQDKGLMKGDGTTTANGQAKQVGARPVPKGAEVFVDSDGIKKFVDPQTGDIFPVK